VISRLQPCRYFFLALLILSTILNSGAQQTSAPKTQIIHAGKLLDVRTGHIETDAYITVIGERIDSISQSAPAADKPIIDMSQYTIVPGLIDAHGHILSDPTTQSSTSYLITSAPQATVRGVANLQLWLKHGFTVVRDACVALREGVAKGLITAPALSPQAVVFRSPVVTVTLIVFPQTSRLSTSPTR
jgi:imidazolonepropionase-like amidohydrolase